MLPSASGGAAGVLGDKCDTTLQGVLWRFYEGDTTNGRAIPATGGRYQKQEGDTTSTPLWEQ